MTFHKKQNSFTFREALNVYGEHGKYYFQNIKKLF